MTLERVLSLLPHARAVDYAKIDAQGLDLLWGDGATSLRRGWGD